MLQHQYRRLQCCLRKYSWQKHEACCEAHAAATCSQQYVDRLTGGIVLPHFCCPSVRHSLIVLTRLRNTPVGLVGEGYRQLPGIAYNRYSWETDFKLSICRRAGYSIHKTQFNNNSFYPSCISVVNAFFAESSYEVYNNNETA